MLMTAGFVCKTKTKHIMGIKFGQIDVRPRKINKERKKHPKINFRQISHTISNRH